jgi:hypothetical protein
MTAELLLAGTGLIFLLLLFYVPQRRFVFSPAFYSNRSWFTERPNKYHLQKIPVAEGIELEIVTYEPNQPKHTILYFGGKDQDSVGLVQKLSAEYPFVRWVAGNYRGYGKSLGRATESTVLSDSLLIFDWVQEQYGETKLMGSRRSSQWLVLIAPFDSVQSLIQAKAFFVPGFFIRYKFPTVDFVQKITSPVYLYNSNSDEIEAPQHVARLRKNILVLADTEEFSGYSHDGLLFSHELKRKLHTIFYAN